MDNHPPCPVAECTIPVDLVLQSADGDQLGAHKPNLENYSDGFPMAESVTSSSKDDPVVLAESTAVLRLMLRFMHHVPQPDLDEVPFETVAAFADAAEKYFIYSAIGMCKLYMMQRKDEHPVQVFAYACRNNHSNIANKTAPLTLDTDAATMLENLGVSHMLKWFMYREFWLKRRSDMMAYIQPAAHLHKGGLSECDLWKPFVHAVKYRLFQCTNLAQIEQEEGSSIEKEMYRLSDCGQCTRRANNWKTRWVSSTAWSGSTRDEIPMFCDL